MTAANVARSPASAAGASQRSANVATVSSPSSRSTDASRAAQASGCPGRARSSCSVAASTPPARRSRAARSGPFQAPSGTQSQLAPQRATPWWQLHDVRSRSRPSGRPDGGGPLDRPGQRRRGVRQVRRRGPADEPCQEVVAQRLVMTVELAVRGDHDERRRLPGERLLLQPRQQSIAHEPVGIHGRRRVEGHGRRQQPVVEHRDDRAAVAQVDPDGTSRVQLLRRRSPTTCHGARTVWVMPWSTSTPQRRLVHGRLGQPHARRAAAEADLEVADAPADLGQLVGRRRERQDRVMEGLGHAVRPAVAVDEPAIRDRVRRPASSRRAWAPGSRTSRRGCRARHWVGSSPR